MDQNRIFTYENMERMEAELPIGMFPEEIEVALGENNMHDGGMIMFWLTAEQWAEVDRIMAEKGISIPHEPTN